MEMGQRSASNSFALNVFAALTMRMGLFAGTVKTNKLRFICYQHLLAQLAASRAANRRLRLGIVAMILYNWKLGYNNFLSRVNGITECGKVVSGEVDVG
jgi:hypothetical protein